jgi:hypothetical protein
MRFWDVENMKATEVVYCKHEKVIKGWRKNDFVCVILPHDTPSTVLTVTTVELMHLLFITSCAQCKTIRSIIISPFSLSQVDHTLIQRLAKRDSLHGAGGGLGRM